jgi:hypothetical protein
MRSGTTLVQRLLDASPGLCVLYQPLMPLFVGAKAEFLRSLGWPDERYPLGPLFLEGRYRPEQFAAFLESWRPDPWPGIEGTGSEAAGDESFADALQRFWRGRCPAVEVLGAKEVLCEEYAPYLASRGVVVVIVLRDPRDVLASTIAGRGHQYTGRTRPTLYTLRNWRKSVAIALHLSRRGLAPLVRFEDVVKDPVGAVAGIAARLLGPSAFTSPHGPPRAAPEANSSFGTWSGVSQEPVGRYQSVLSPALVRYVETVCGPEMRAIGYPTRHDQSEDAAAVLAEFKEPCPVEHDALARDYSNDPANIAAELRRLEFLQRPSIGAEHEPYFVFREVWEALRGDGAQGAAASRGTT